MNSKDLQNIQDRLRQIFDLVENQPPADDLEATSIWFVEVNSALSTWAQMNGELEAGEAVLISRVLSSLTEDEFKLVKGSSTLITKFCLGKYPAFATIREQSQSLGKVLSDVCQNTRTLMASIRLERENDLRSQFKQQ